LLTLEVEIRHGRLVAREPEKVPESGWGLLTILPSPAAAPSLLQVLERLQKHLHLNERQAADWMARVQDARR
jgi:hypothetical protein